MSGKTKTEFVQAPVPAPPSFTQSLDEYIRQAPRLFDLERQFSPQLADLEFQNFQRYAPQVAQIQSDIEEQAFPGVQKLRGELVRQAQEGLVNPIPREYLDQYSSDFNAQVGNNVNAPIGINTRNIGLMNLQNQWKQYYQGLAGDVAGRPNTQVSAPTFANAAPSSPTSFLPNALNYNMQGYGSHVNALAQSTVATKRSPNTFGNLALPIANTAIAAFSAMKPFGI